MLVLQVEAEARAQLSRFWGIGAAAKNGAQTAARCGTATQLVEGGGLIQLIQLIYLRYLRGSAEREERMDVCFLLTLYI